MIINISKFFRLSLHHQRRQAAALISKSFNCVTRSVGCVFVFGTVLENLSINAADHESRNHVAYFFARSSCFYHRFETCFLASNFFLAVINGSNSNLRSFYDQTIVLYQLGILYLNRFFFSFQLL